MMFQFRIVKWYLSNLGIILHITVTNDLFHKPFTYLFNLWKSIQSEPPIDYVPLYQKLSKNVDLDQRISFLLEFIRNLVKKRFPSINWLD
jgi:hypothetical protein